MIKIEAAELKDFVADIFAANGCSRQEAGRISKYLVNANLAGHDSHGVVRVARYVAMQRDGLVVADQTVESLVDTPVLAIVDGKHGFGQTVAPQAVELGIAKCRRHGLAAVGLRNAGHIGRIGDWAQMAAEADLVSIHFVTADGSILVAPFGGIERRFSTAPFCIGVPRDGADPLILDFATSIVAEGKVLVASQGGKQLPANALVAPDGTMSDEPQVLYGAYEASGPRDFRKGAGAIRAFGDHKGSGLALMCELLGGALTGMGAPDPNHRFANGMFSIYVDPGVTNPDAFLPEVARYTQYVKSSRPLPPQAEVLVPGEPEARQRAERLAHGIALPEDTWGSILEAARSLAITEARIEQVLRK
jgi:hydroxycarboxylate dehydrogenase B